MNSTKRKSTLSGVLHLAAEFVSANSFLIFFVIFLLMLTSVGQIRDAATTASDQPSLKLWLPIVSFSLLLLLSSLLANAIVSDRLDQIAVDFGFLRHRIYFISQFALPFLLALTGPIFAVIVTHDTWDAKLVGTLLGIFVGALFIAVIFNKYVFTHRTVITLKLLFSCVLGACAILILASLNTEFNRLIGTVGVVLVALGVWATVLNTVFIWLVHRFKLPSMFVLASAVAIMMALPAKKPDPVPQIPTYPQSDPPFPTSSVAERLEGWLTGRYNVDPGKPIPLIIVASEGGGIRAAYWTARKLAVLNADVGGALVQNIFAYSGVSGGSLGVATFFDAATNLSLNPEKVIDVIDRFYSQDFLSPIVSRLLFIEPIRTVSGRILQNARRDSAFEQQLSDDWHKATGSMSLAKPFLESVTRPTPALAPAMVLNATRVESGLRVVISNVSLPTGTESRSHNFFKPRYPWGYTDLTLAEAIHLSARFPFVSPPANVYAPYYTPYSSLKKNMVSGMNETFYPDGCSIESPPTERCGRWSQEHWGTVVDGGYIENSGVASIREIVGEIFKLRTQWLALNDEADMLDSDQKLFQSLLRRLSVHVLVLRNDPNPLVSVRLRPLRHQMSDIEALVNSMLQARSARAGTEIGFLTEEIRALSNDRTSLCPMASQNKFSLPAPYRLSIIKKREKSRNCERFPDTVSVVNMQVQMQAELLLEMRKKFPISQLPCPNVNELNEPPLGWSLSKTTRDTIRCLTEISGRKTTGFAELENFRDYWFIKAK